MKNKIVCLIFVFLSGAGSLKIADAQTGGGYDISHNTIVGGGKSAGSNFTVEGTIGQNIVGTLSAGTSGTGNQYNLSGGFWVFQSLAPTAAVASISGCVRSSKRVGIIRRVSIRLIDAFSGIERTTQTGADGSYQFEEVEVGRFYIIRAESSNFVFTPDNYFLELMENQTEINFTAERVLSS